MSFKQYTGAAQTGTPGKGGKGVNRCPADHGRMAAVTPEADARRAQALGSVVHCARRSSVRGPWFLLCGAPHVRGKSEEAVLVWRITPFRSDHATHEQSHRWCLCPSGECRFRTLVHGWLGSSSMSERTFGPCGSRTAVEQGEDSSSPSNPHESRGSSPPLDDPGFCCVEEMFRCTRACFAVPRVLLRQSLFSFLRPYTHTGHPAPTGLFA